MKLSAFLLYVVWYLVRSVISLQTPNLARRPPQSIKWQKSTQLNKWFEDWELCMLERNASRPVVHLAKEARECAQKKVLLQCRLGDTYRHRPCVLPNNPTDMQTFQHFKYAPEGYDNPDSRYMAGVMRTLSQYNGSMLVLGDSMLSLFAKAASCEMKREEIVPWQPYEEYVSAVKFYRAVPGAGIAGMSRPTRELAGSVPFQFLMTGYMVADLTERAMTLARKYLQEHDSLLLVINTGLRYNTVEHLRRDMSRMFSELLKLAEEVENAPPTGSSSSNSPSRKVLSIAVFETFAQHFDTPTGYFKEFGEPNTKMCSPITDWSWESDWRNHLMWDSYINGAWGRRITAMKRVAFTVLSGRAVTESLHDMHVRHDFHDCTHFCYTPMMYQPIFHELQQLTDLIPQLAK